MSKKKKKKWKEVIETDEKLHGNVKNTNNFCKGCVELEDCLIGRMAAVAFCKDYRGE